LSEAYDLICVLIHSSLSLYDTSKSSYVGNLCLSLLDKWRYAAVSLHCYANNFQKLRTVNSFVTFTVHHGAPYVVVRCLIHLDEEISISFCGSELCTGTM